MKCPASVMRPNPLLSLFLLLLGRAWMPTLAAPPTSPPDARLEQKLSLALKATALSDLCARLRQQTGVALTAGQSVADEKVTVFCRERPLREVMRQLSQPFGYSWLRSGAPPGLPNAGGETGYRYELVQDLRSQLEEEELLNRDRRAALLALDREMSAYRRYLDLSPDEAQARAAGAAPEEKQWLERLAGFGWGAAQLYFRLSPDELVALRAGQELQYDAKPKPDERPLPPELARGVLQSLRDLRIEKRNGEIRTGSVSDLPTGLPPSSFPEVHVHARLMLHQSELGTLTLEGASGYFLERRGVTGRGVLAVGQSPAARTPQNAAANAASARDPALRPTVTVSPRPSCDHAQPPGYPGPLFRDLPREGTPRPGPKVTSADVLEALSRTTDLPIVADFYTRLYPPEAVTVSGLPLFEALNRLADTLRLRWRKDGDWLQLRSATYFTDRLKEVPNRLLERWAASRREHGMLTLDDLIEIAGLSDVQLDSNTMAEGARVCFGLAEWDLTREGSANWVPGRQQWRYLAGFSPEQRQKALSPEGLAFREMSSRQQQGFLAFALGTGPDMKPPTAEELDAARLQVVYTVPGWFEWAIPEPDESGFPYTLYHARRPALVRERSRDAALQAARRIDPRVTPEQIQPTVLHATMTYSLGVPGDRRGQQFMWNGVQSGLRRLPK